MATHPLTRLTPWTLPLVLASSLIIMALPRPAHADAFANATSGLGGYALLRQGDLEGAQSFFIAHYERGGWDGLTLQGLAEVALLRGQVAKATEYIALLENNGEAARVDYLRARQAHLADRWVEALTGYGHGLAHGDWAEWARPHVATIYNALGDTAFAGTVNGLAVQDPALGEALNAELSLLRNAHGWAPRHESSHPTIATVWEPTAFVVENEWATVEAAVRQAWADHDQVRADNLLNAAARQFGSNAQCQALLRESLLHEMNRTPVPAAKRTVPLGTFADGKNLPTNWDFAGQVPSDIPFAGELAAYWTQLGEIEAVTSGYYNGLVGEVQMLQARVQMNTATGNLDGLMQDLADLQSMVNDAIGASHREIAATSALPVPYGFEKFATKYREYQDVRTGAFTDLQNFFYTQNPMYLESADAKIDQFQALADAAVTEFLTAYDRAPESFKIDPEAEAEEDAEKGEEDGEESDKEMSDGEREYGPEFDFDLPEDGSFERVAE